MTVIGRRNGVGWSRAADDYWDRREEQKRVEPQPIPLVGADPEALTEEIVVVSLQPLHPSEEEFLKAQEYDEEERLRWMRRTLIPPEMLGVEKEKKS